MKPLTLIVALLLILSSGFAAARDHYSRSGSSHFSGAQARGSHYSGTHFRESHFNGRNFRERHFRDRDFGRSHIGVFFGAPGFWYDPLWYDPYPYSYYPPVVVVPSSPPTYIERGQAQSAPSQANNWWYYCPASKTYYPYVRECHGGWQRVTPQPPPAR